MSTKTFKEVIDTCQEKTWSLLSPTPVTKYFSEIDQHITFINGKALPRNVAFVLIASQVYKIRISNVVTKVVAEEYDRFLALTGQKLEYSDVNIFIQKNYNLDELAKSHKIFNWFNFTRE